jgi:EAL domain-containing protein (putative c-di-GMP-specific phosphodiesterase class I)/ActR/RegA family two-component response regulator
MSAVLADAACVEAGATNRSAWIVINDRVDAAAIAGVLTDAGWTVLHAAHDIAGVEALFERDERVPDLIVTGLRFADGDGFQLIRRLARHSRQPAVFVVSHQQRAVIKTAVALADACGLTTAGIAEQPIDPEALRRDFAAFEPRRQTAPRRVSRPALTRDELTALLDRGGLEVWLQPKLRIATREVVGFEALMRGRDDEGKLISPDRMVAGLASHGLLDQATLCIARQTMAFVARCLDEGMAISASINVSMQALSSIAFCQSLADAVDSVRLDPSWITIEITETDAMADLASVIENTGRIRMLGFNIAIDDFGTAYSSLFQLSRIPFSELKIERAFITGVDSDGGKQAIVTACAQLGASLGLHVVAEGVETVAELEYLTRAGCDQIQGYLVAQPMSAPQALDWLKRLEDLHFPVT